jgi:hypothetical protein
MRIIDTPSPTNGVRLHLLSGNRIGVSHARGGMANDADPNDQSAAQPPDSISKLMQFLADKLEPNDLTQAQTLIEQALSDTSTSATRPGHGNPVAVGMDAKARKSFVDRWGPNANRVRTV